MKTTLKFELQYEELVPFQKGKGANIYQAPALFWLKGLFNKIISYRIPDSPYFTGQR